MDLIFDGLSEAWRLLVTGDSDVYGITFRTVVITGASTLIALAIGLPVGLGLALVRFPGQRGLVALANAGTARLPLLVAVMAGFGAVVSEVGASMMVGGNLSGETRVLTTAAVLEVSKGNFGTALALGFVLLAFIVVIAGLLTAVQQRARRQ